MSKRKLTRRQHWRINKIQEEKAARLARKQQHADSELNTDGMGPETEGIIVSHLGSLLDVMPLPADTATNDNTVTTVSCHFRANLGGLVAGDHVAFREDGHGRGVIETRLPRRTSLARPDSRGELKPVAANIDFLLLVITPEPAPSSVLIDRYLVAAELQGLPVKLLLNKTDLLNADNSPALDALLTRYAAIGYPVLRCSTKTSDGLHEVQAALDGQIVVFVGQSGVGKSSLVNALLPAAAARVGELSESSGLGRHTTTNARLFTCPSGGYLIDSPGIREFGLWHLEPSAVIEGFREFQPWRQQCRFRDCQHQAEPGCALKTAAETGAIDPERLRNYHAIVAQLQ